MNRAILSMLLLSVTILSSGCSIPIAHVVTNIKKRDGHVVFQRCELVKDWAIGLIPQNCEWHVLGEPEAQPE